MCRARSIRFAGIALLALLAVAPAAPAATFDVPGTLGAELRRVAAKTDVPVRVPAAIELDFDGTAFGWGSGTKASWTLGLDGSEDCGGANACFLASFSGERRGTPAFRRTVKLTRGVSGYYKPLTCGGSCSPPMIQWKQRGALFTIQANVGVAGAAAQRAEMIRAANSAITSRPR